MNFSLKTWLIVIGIGIVGGYFLSDLVFKNDQYIAAIHEQRKEKNREFHGMNSPLETPERPAFDSLDYFEANKDYKILADLEVFENPTTIQMQLSGGDTEAYWRYGKARFKIGGKKQKLILFKKVKEDKPTLFVPFTDKTNGFETYGGGRFLDLPVPGANANAIELDFNQAYNPFCAYNHEYSCPVPPEENRLQIRIPAGEKSFRK